MWSGVTCTHRMQREAPRSWTETFSVTTAKPQHHIQQTQAWKMAERGNKHKARRTGHKGSWTRTVMSLKQRAKEEWQWKGKKEKLCGKTNPGRSSLSEWAYVSERVSWVVSGRKGGRSEDLNQWGGLGPYCGWRGHYMEITHEAERTCSSRGNPHSPSAMTTHTVTRWSDSPLRR